MQLASFLPHYQLVCISFDISSFSLISYRKQRLVLPKTTARFTKNNGSFYQKQRLVLLRRKTSAEAFAVISPRAHTLFCSYTSLRKAKIAQTSPICAEINLIIRNKTLTLPNLLRDLWVFFLMRTSTMQRHIRYTSQCFIPLSSSRQLPQLLLSHNLPNYANTLSSLSTY